MGEMREGTPTGELTFIQRRGAEPRSAPNRYRESHEALQKTIGTRLPSYSTKGVASREVPQLLGRIGAGQTACRCSVSSSGRNGAGVRCHSTEKTPGLCAVEPEAV